MIILSSRVWDSQLLHLLHPLLPKHYKKTRAWWSESSRAPGTLGLLGVHEGIQPGESQGGERGGRGLTNEGQKVGPPICMPRTQNDK